MAVVLRSRKVFGEGFHFILQELLAKLFPLEVGLTQTQLLHLLIQLMVGLFQVNQSLEVDFFHAAGVYYVVQANNLL